MNIFDYADSLNLDFVVTRHPGDNIKDAWWSAKFEHTHVREGCVQASCYGKGPGPWHAIEDYQKQIVGKVIEYDHYNSAAEKMVTVQQQVPKLSW